MLFRLDVRSFGAGLVHQRFRRAERHFRGQRGFAHARPSRQDHQIGRMHPAQFGVDAVEAGGQAGDVARLVEGGFGGLDRLDQSGFEGHEPAVVAAAIGRELEQGLFGGFDLVRTVQFGVGAESIVDDGFADIDQLPPQPGIVDRLAILARVDDPDHRGQELSEVGGAADLLQHARVFEFRLQRDGVGQLAGFDPAGDGLEDAAVDRVGEMDRRQELRNPFVRAVIGQQRTQKRLFGLKVGRRQTLGQAQERSVNFVHAVS